MVHQIAPSAFKMKKGGGHIFQLSLICTLKAIEVIKKVKKRKKDWVIELRQINTLCGGVVRHLLTDYDGPLRLPRASTLLCYRHTSSHPVPSQRAAQSSLSRQLHLKGTLGGSLLWLPETILNPQSSSFEPWDIL